MEHGRRRILRFNATFYPTAAWVIQQLFAKIPRALGGQLPQFVVCPLLPEHASPLVGMVRIQKLDNEIYESPIVDKRRDIYGLLGVTYRFAKLPTRPS